MSSSYYGPDPPPFMSPAMQGKMKKTSSVRVPPPSVDIFVNSVYYANWRIYRNERPSSLRYDIISHVYYAFAWVKADGTVYLSDEWADTQLQVDGHHGCLGAFLALKRQHRHLKLMLSIGGGGVGSQHFPTVASNPLARENFGRTARNLVTTHGLDGIDIDWEHPSTLQEGTNYIALLGAIRNHLPSPAFLVTTALPAGTWALRNINLSAAQHFLDHLNLMTYDFSGPWTDACGHQAQLFAPSQPHNDAARLSCSTAVEYVRSQGVPAQKIVLGVPVYGRSFLGAQTVGDRFAGHGGSDGTFDYRDLPRPGTVECNDVDLGAAFCVGGDGGFVSYDNPHSVKLKAAFVRQQCLGGLFYWTGTADGHGRRSLVEAGFTGLHQ
ncbi:MAG: hypothetical protein M1837_006420 [Sclerophora amabilis]|nr:MAG: hypothetical protein M1837_006420 [Sclerophora amabilis]